MINVAFVLLLVQPPKPEGWESRFLGEPWSLRTQLYK
jgi:hypothetical protein